MKVLCLKTWKQASRLRTWLIDLICANAYLGAEPIADALAGGAKIVITGRVADASLTVGPAVARFGWRHRMTGTNLPLRSVGRSTSLSVVQGDRRIVARLGKRP